MPPQLILSADDFGLSESVNEAVEQAHRDGILAAASLMVAAPAAADAVHRAKSLPNLRVGLHLVAIEGRATLLPSQIPDLVDSAGQFPSDQLRLGVRYANPRLRAQLRSEIHAQFAAFTATGLQLDHANAHKHMHLHPVVGRLLTESGLRHGLRALRIPSEPPRVLAACGTPPRLGDRALYRWTAILRRQARAAGLLTNDHCFGIAWTGAMTADKLIRLAPNLPPGISEIYFHPATAQTPQMQSVMPGYQQAAELSALRDPSVRRALEQAGTLTTYTALTEARA